MKAIVEIHLIWGNHEKNLKEDKARWVQLKEGALVEELLIQLNIPVQEIGLIVINGFVARFDTPVKQGDRIQLFPHIQGG